MLLASSSRRLLPARIGAAAARRSSRIKQLIPAGASSALLPDHGGDVYRRNRHGATRHFSTPPPPPNNNGNSNNMNLPSWLTGQEPKPGDFLNQFTTDLTQLAADDKLDPLIGRHDELQQCLQTLARRTKNNCVFIGEAGVGKTALAHGLALRIHSGLVPESMKTKRVLSLDLAALTAGTAVRGQWEERIKGVLKDVAATNGQVIMFLDELHILMKAGKGEGSLDMANLLKPALAAGDLQMVGATTLAEYQQLEKDAALARRFQPVYVKEPSVDDTLSILRGLKTLYELHHAGLRIKDEALVAAATLSDRYITERFQPDKSIDLVDEACSKLRLEQESKPEIIWKLEQELLTRQIEQTALENEEGPQTPAQQRRKAQVAEQVKDLQQQVQELTDKWQTEKTELNRVHTVKNDLEQAKAKMEAARRKGNFTLAAEYMHATIPQLEQELQELEDRTNESSSSNTTMLAQAVTAPAIAAIISSHTGIPVSKLTAGEAASQHLLTLEDSLRQRVVGQEHALSVVADTVRLARTHLQAHDQTLGNLLFLGPTGVGKTELCKAIAQHVFDNEAHLTRIDMSEYGEKHQVSRLLGAPPGYVGYDEGGGTLTESVRRRPYQVVLLDEFEKAHPDVWNVLLQVFDEGRLTDSHGRTVDFRNTLLVLTSNLGAEKIANLPPDVQGSEPHVRDEILAHVRPQFSPELWNRLDHTIVFNRLQREDMAQIVKLRLDELAGRLKEQHDMTLDISDTAQDLLAERGYDVRYGARPLRRVLTQTVLHPTSRLLLQGALQSGEAVRVCTRAEAERRAKQLSSADNSMNAGWISSNPHSEDKNDLVILRNHSVDPETTTSKERLEAGDAEATAAKERLAATEGPSPNKPDNNSGDEESLRSA